MDSFVWSSRYETGVPLIDEQHQKLVALTNAFGEALAAHTELTTAQTDETFQVLATYAKEHFTDEEALMRSAGVDPRFIDNHHRQHEGFLAEVVLMHRAVLGGGAGGAEPARMVMNFLVSWLAFHILGSDKQVARQLALVAQGVPAADAFAREARNDDGSARLILGAVDDLLRLVATRNRELSDANASLERRVAERTAQLSAALTELKAAELSLVEAAKLASVGQLASGLAHEINNPMAFIVPNVELLAEATQTLSALARDYQRAEHALPEPLRAQLAGQRQAANLDFFEEELPGVVEETKEGLARVRTIVASMKDFSRVDGTRVQPVDLNRALDTVLSVLPASRRGGARVVREFGAPPQVSCLAGQLNQTLLALVTNAFQAIEAGASRPGTVTLRTGVDGELVWAEVADDGVGLSAEAKAHLFEPFFTTRPVGQGMGLGLSAAWTFARRHGGRLELDGGPGQPTRARLSLPRVAVPLGPDEPALSNAWNARRS